MSDTNPHDNADSIAQLRTKLAYLTKGTVAEAPRDQTDGQHHVSVQQDGEIIANDVPVITRAHTDSYIPPNGSPVYMAADANGDYVVVGTPVPHKKYNTVMQPGERIISHPLTKTHARIYENGSVDVIGDITDDYHYRPHIKFEDDGTFEVQADTNKDEHNQPKITVDSDGAVRIIGDSGDSHNQQIIEYNADGSIDIQSDGAPVKINGGGAPVVTDVTYDTSTDEIVVHKNNTVQVPSANTTERNAH